MKIPPLSPRVARFKRLLSSLPHTESQPGASRALSCQPTGRAPPFGAAHVGRIGLCADARAQAAPASCRLLGCSVCVCVCFCVSGVTLKSEVFAMARRVACLWQ